MNNKNDLISESQQWEQKIAQRDEHMKSLVEKEKYLTTLPYYDEYPRVGYNKFKNCRTLSARTLTYATIGGLFFSHLAPKFRYGTIHFTIRLHDRPDVFQKYYPFLCCGILLLPYRTMSTLSLLSKR
jgi:hypothetical protein